MMLKRVASITCLIIPAFKPWILNEPVCPCEPPLRQQCRVCSRTSSGTQRRNVIHSLSFLLVVFRCIYAWEGFVWLTSICSCKWSPCRVVLIRKRGAVATETPTCSHPPHFILSRTVAPPSGLHKTKPFFLTTHSLSCPQNTSEILSFNSISFPPHEEWHCNQHWFPSHGVMIEIFVVRVPRRCSHLYGFIFCFCFFVFLPLLEWSPDFHPPTVRHVLGCEGL